MAIQVPTYDFNGAQVKVNLRTVAGVRQLFRFQFVRSDGSVVSMDGQKFTGRVNTSPVTEFECVGNEDGVDIVWGKLPAGRFSYEVCCGSQVVFFGDMIVQGRMLPPLEGEGDVSVNDSLVMSVEEESIAFECSEVGLMTLLERQAMVYMGESKELRDEVAELHQALENKVAEAGSDLSQMLEQAEEAQTNAQQSATLASEFAEQVETTHGLVEDLATQAKSDAEVASRAKVSAENTLASVGGYAQSAEQAKAAAEQAKASAEQEAYNAYSHGSAAKASADVAITKATEASASAELAESKAEEAKESEESARLSAESASASATLIADYTFSKAESDARYGQLAGGNLWSGSNVFSLAPVVPNVSEPVLTNALNFHGGMGLSCMSQLFETKVNFDNWMTHAGAVSVTSNRYINLKLSFTKKNYPSLVGRVFFSALGGTQGIYGGATGVVIPLFQAINGGDKSGWIKLSFEQFTNYNTVNFAKNYTLEDEDAFVIYPVGNTSSLLFDITYRCDSAKTYYRTRYLRANTSFASGFEMVEQNAVINFSSNSWGTQVRAYFIFGDTVQEITYIFVLVGNTLCKIAEMPYFKFYEQSHYRDIQVSVGGLGEGCYGDVAFTDQTGLSGITNINTGSYVAPWLDIAKALSIDCVTERKEAVEFVPPVTEEASAE